MDDVEQMLALVQLDGGGDLHHLQEGHGALLHAGATGGGEASNGNRSAVARVIAAVIRSAAATPIDPARKSNSQASTATRRPNTVPSPVSTDSSRPDFSAAAASSAR